MQSGPKKPYLGENQVARGVKSPQPKRSSGVAIHRSGTQGPVQEATTNVRRPGYRPPTHTQPKG
jgi:hypothetical protein